MHFLCSSVQRITQVAILEPLLQSKERRAGLTEDERHAEVFRNVSCSAAKAVAAIKSLHCHLVVPLNSVPLHTPKGS